MSKSSVQNKSRGFLLVVYLTIITVAIGCVNADEVPAFFLKIAKNIPRVGRSEKSTEPSHFKLNEANQQSFNNGESYRLPHKRMINYPAPGDIDGVSWEHFPLAIEGPPELWRTLASYTYDKYGSSADSIDNEIWQRMK